MLLPPKKAILIHLTRPRIKRRIISDLILRGLTPLGNDFFEKLDSKEEHILMVEIGYISFPSKQRIEEEQRQGYIVAIFPSDAFAKSMLRLIGFTEEERKRVFERAFAVMHSLSSSLDEEANDAPLPPKKKA